MSTGRSFGCIFVLIYTLAGQSALACMLPGGLEKNVSHAHSIFVANILEHAMVLGNETGRVHHAKLTIDVVEVLHGENLEGKKIIYLASNNFKPLSVYMGVGKYIMAVTSELSAGSAYLWGSIGSGVVDREALWVIGGGCTNPYLFRYSERSLSLFDEKLDQDLKRRLLTVDE